MELTHNDYEYLIILAVLLLIFVTSLRPKSGGGKCFDIDLPTSSALKGIACVFILMGHWANMRIRPGGFHPGIDISKCIWLFSANIALTWFMFFSGYGMSLKRIKAGEYFARWRSSMFKIYVPCLLASVVAFLLYMLLPDKFSPEESVSLWLSPNIYIMHHLASDNNIASLLWSFFSGNGSWYVGCIIMFYTFFYSASYISEKKRWPFTLVLAIFFLIYFIAAYFYFGPSQAHYYRYCWTFLFGHAVATRTRLSWTVATISLITVGTENWVLHMSYVMAIIGLCLVSALNTRYSVHGKSMLWMGSISYLFYLSHESISYVLITYLNIDSVIVWILFSTMVASILYVIKKRVII